jgi:hypothetical protein
MSGLAHGQATCNQLHHSAIQAGMRVSVQGLDQRFKPSAVTFMRTLLETALSEMVSSEQTQGMLPQFNGVYVTDCTRLVWAGGGEKLAVRFELQHGTLQASLSEINRHDQKTEMIERTLPPAALHLGDLGFFKLKRFQRWNEQGVYWLSRFKVGTTVMTLDGQVLDLKKVLSGQTEVVIPVKVGAKQSVTAFLVAAPLPEAAQQQRHKRLKETARLDQRPISARQSELANWTIYLTNIPRLNFTQAYTLARTRWQIELLFKLWKSHGQILTSRSADPVRQHCEGYAKLLGVLLAHWMLLVTGWHHPTLGTLDALRILRTYVPFLQRIFTDPSGFQIVFSWIVQDLAHAPRLSKRRKVPLAYQLWQQFDLGFS